MQVRERDRETDVRSGRGAQKREEKDKSERHLTGGRKSITLFEDSQPSADRPSHTNGTQMKFKLTKLEWLQQGPEKRVEKC